MARFRPRWSAKTGAAALMGVVVLVVAVYFTGFLDGASKERDSKPKGEARDFTPHEFAPPSSLRPGFVRVVRVVDGDTIRISRAGKSEPEAVRLIGIDTPELAGTRSSVSEPGAVEAALWLENLLAQNPQVTLEYDTDRADDFGRTLAYAWVWIGEDRRMLNEELVLEGHAKAHYYPPNGKYRQRLEAAQRNPRVRNPRK